MQDLAIAIDKLLGCEGELPAIREFDVETPSIRAEQVL